MLRLRVVITPLTGNSRCRACSGNAEIAPDQEVPDGFPAPFLNDGIVLGRGKKGTRDLQEVLLSEGIVSIAT
jgi:hypothetical protein